MTFQRQEIAGQMIVGDGIKCINIESSSLHYFQYEWSLILTYVCLKTTKQDWSISQAISAFNCT
jgi:hypothetical protein